MKHVLWAVLALTATAQASFAGLVFELGVTNRVDTLTQVTLTYTLTGMADGTTQDIGAYAARVAFGGLTASTYLASTPLNITRAPDLTVFGVNPSGPFTLISVMPNSLSVRWQANDVLASGTQNVTVDATPHVIGTFNLIWNRPLTGSYDSALAVVNVTGGYKVAPFDNFDPFTPGLGLVVDRGVSSVIEAVPEPGSAVLLGAGLCLAGLTGWLRRRGTPSN
jgi:hypothetical protein